MRKMGMALLFLAMIFASAGTALAGTINPEEARVIDAASGIFVYEGVEYKSTESALDSLTAYLNQDGVDLTELQANRAIQLMNYEKNIQSAIEGGYIVPVSGGSGNDPGDGDGSGDGDGTGDGNGTGGGSGDGTDSGGDSGDGSGSGGQDPAAPDGEVRLLFREAILTAMNGDGDVVYESSLPVKNTGYRIGLFLLPALLLGLIGCIIAVRIPGKQRLWAVPLVFLFLLGGILFSGGSEAAHALRDTIYSSLALGAPETAYVPEGQRTAGGDLPRDGVLDGSELLPPAPGSLYAGISSEAIELNAPVYFGDTEEIFGKGVGQYVLSGLPGEGNPILMGAHDVSWFAGLEDLRPGDTITLTTGYGIFEYDVAEIFVAKADAGAWTRLSDGGGERLVLYTCYPIGSLLGARDERLFVVCDKSAGPRIVKTGGSL